MKSKIINTINLIKYILFIMICVLHNNTNAQTNPPAGITFQAVAIDDNGMELSGVDAGGIPIPDKAIKVQFSIINDNPNGTVEYAEEHLTNTDKYGLFSLIIGTGTPNTGKYLKSVNWHIGKKYLKVEIDVNSGKGYKLVSVQQMMSVPYALYSGESLEAKMVDTARMRDSVLMSNGIKKVQSNLDKHIAADQDTVSTNELQQLSLSGGTLDLSLGGGKVKLPDSSSTNELQTIGINGGTIGLSQGGGTIQLPDSSATNELQTIGINGGTIELSQGGGSIQLPDSSDVNEIQTLSISGNKISISGAGGNTITLPGSGGGSDRIIRGTTTGGFSPSTINGSGFTVSRMWDGTYSVAFTTAFSTTPSAVVSVYHSGGSPFLYYNAVISSISTTGMVIKTGYNANGGDYFLNSIAFSFVVVGQ
jgi:hypothetical protein